MVLRAQRAWLAAACLAAGMSTASAQPAAALDPVLASVDVEITQKVVDADGSSPWPIPPRTAFTVQKVRTESGVKVVLAYRPVVGAERNQASAHPLDGARVELDPSTGTTVVFDRGGTRRNPRLSAEGSAAAPLEGSGAWIDALVFTRVGIPARRQELERLYGQAVGSSGRLARHRHTRDGLTEEVLADPAWGVPVAVTVTRQDTREGHITFEYGSTPSGNLFRRAVHSERILDPQTGRRFVQDIQFSNVRMEGW